MAKQHNFMSCHHSRRKRTSSHGILKSQIPGFAFYHFISFQFISSAAHTPLALFPYFVFHVFPLETINQCHPPHTQTLHGFLLTLSCLDPTLNISLGVFRPCGHLFLAYLGLDSVEPSEPEDLSTSEFSLCMIYFFNIFIELFLRDLLLLSEPPCLL